MAIQKVKNKNGEWVIVSGVNKPLTIDSTLSDTSENPVQSKVLKQYVDNAIQNVEIDIDSELSNTSENPIQNKVITEVLTNKQDKIEDIETIRSGAALGATALQEHQDISHLATKEEVNNIIIDNESVIATSIVNLDEKIDTINLTLPYEYATKLELNKTIDNLSNNIIDNESVIATSIVNLNEKIDTINLTLPYEYATKLELNKTIDNLSNNIIDNESVIATMFIELQERVLNLEKIIENINNF